MFQYLIKTHADSNIYFDISLQVKPFFTYLYFFLYALERLKTREEFRYQIFVGRKIKNSPKNKCYYGCSSSNIKILLDHLTIKAL